jgi:hypothetical protein
MRILIVCGAVVLLSGQAVAGETDKATNPLYSAPVGEQTNPMAGKAHGGGGNASPLYDAQGLEAERGHEPKTPPVRAEKGAKSDEPSAESAAAAGKKGAMSGAQSNPLYQDKGQSGNNPLYKGD